MTFVFLFVEKNFIILNGRVASFERMYAKKYYDKYLVKSNNNRLVDETRRMKKKKKKTKAYNDMRIFTLRKYRNSRTIYLN